MELLYHAQVVAGIMASKSLKDPQTSSLRICEKLAVLIMQCQYCIHTFICQVLPQIHGFCDDVWWYWPLETIISGTTDFDIKKYC